MINIILVEPEIPPNTGNIARTCAAIGAKLHLVHPLGFEINEKSLRRAGLDYWHLMEVEEHRSFDAFVEKYPDSLDIGYYSTTKGGILYTEMDKSLDDMYIFFGKETKGLPESLLAQHPDRCIRIPMKKNARSLNLSNAVAIVAYEALRGNNKALIIEE